MEDISQVIDTAIDDEVEDPFIPGTNIQWAWDSTSLGNLKTCPRKYQYINIEGWRKKGDNVHLRYGGEVHTSLQQYHISRANGVDHEGSVFDVVRDLLYRIEGWAPEEAKNKDRYTLIRTVVDYLDYYEDDPAKTVIKPDGKPAVELSFRLRLDDLMVPVEYDQYYYLCGHLDRVVDYNGTTFVDDYKTTTQTLGSYYFKQYEPNNQMSLYTQAAFTILSSEVKGVIIDGIQIMADQTRFVRDITYRTEGQLAEWIDDLSYWFGQAFEYADRGYWPMNDTSCRMCQFQEICSKDPEVREQFLKANFEKGPRWNPLTPR